MKNLIEWLELHGDLAGWLQFAGAMWALLITYLTAFAPEWRRRRQLELAARRLLENGYEVIESYYRTSAHFLPTPISLRAAGLSMNLVASEIERFPIFELSDQGPRSIARHLVAVSGQLKLLDLVLAPIADELEARDATVEDQNMIRELVKGQLDLVEAILTGKELRRPEWPV